MLSVSRQIAALVHPLARLGEVERKHHEDFIALRLALALPFMALAPIFLLIGGAPTAWNVLALVFLLGPLVGVYVLSRYGRFDIAQSICVATLILLGVTLTCGAGRLTVGAVACFVLAPLEAALGSGAALAIGGATFSLVAVVVLTIVNLLGWLPDPSSENPLTDFVIIAPAVIYGALLAVWSARLGEMRDRRARDSLASYRELTETMGDMAMRLDRSGAVIHVAAPQAGDGLRYAPRDLMGRGLFERILVSDRPKFLTAIANAAATDAVICVEFLLRASPVIEAAFENKRDREDPVFIAVEMRAHRRDEANGVILAVLRDMTPLKQAQAESEAARVAAERANIAKDRFLANVSHELRTPLNAIIGFSEMLGNPLLAPKDIAKQREYANIINASGLHLLSVVNSILDMSKIESGNFPIEPESFRLDGLVDFCCDVLRLKAEAKQLAFSRACPPQLEEIVADKRACKQILLNLLSNAVKFTPEGGKVAVVARADGAFVEIAISDTGIGVRPQDLGRLGDPFFQARGNHDRPYEGTGLGLSVVRGLVGLHGGSIAIESAPGQGTLVIVRLPMDCRRPADMVGPQPAQIATLASGRSAASKFDLIRPQDQVKKIA
jgi:cell cycle sensor histidine kinase DivJ